MKGLMLKDFYTLTKQLKIFILFIFIFACLPGLSVSAFALVYAAMLPVTAFAYDERSKWDHLAVMMPYSAKSIVMSKYLLGYVCVAVAGILTAAANAVIGVIKHTPSGTESYLSLTLLLCAALAIQSFNLPLMFKLGVEKGRIALFIVIGAVTAIAAASGDSLSTHLTSQDLRIGGVLAAALAGVLVLNVASVAVSVRFYEMKAK